MLSAISLYDEQARSRRLEPGTRSWRIWQFARSSRYDISRRSPRPLAVIIRAPVPDLIGDDPAIHQLEKGFSRLMDARVKPAHDEKNKRRLRPNED
jgi:hypothetical protein